MNAGELPQEIRYTIDLKDNLVQQTMRGKLVKNDRAANKVIVSIVDGKEEVDLSGVSVTGGFIRPGDSAEIPLSGSTDGNKASVTLEDACYEQAGTIEIFIRLSLGGITRTILKLTGDVIPKGSGAYVDITGAIPSIEDIIEQYAEMQAVTQRTIAAAQRAENLTIDASGLAGDANRLGGKPPEYYTQPRDLLVNSDFRNPVNQRGQNEYAGEGYTIDRWLMPVDGAKLYKNSNSISVTGLFWQYVPAEVISNPSTIHTLVFRTKDGRTKILSKAMNAAYSIDYNIGIGFGYDAALQKYIVASGSPDEYIWAALYEGTYTAETLPPYMPKGYAAELAACNVADTGCVERTLIHENTTYVVTGFPENPTTASNTKYTTPADGIFYLFATCGETAGNTIRVYILKPSGETVAQFNIPAYYPYAMCCLTIPVKRGMKIKVDADSASATWMIREQKFFY